MATPSKSRVRGRSVAEIAGSSSAGSSATDLSRGVLSNVVCLSVCEALTMRRPWPTRGCRATGEQICTSLSREYEVLAAVGLEDVIIHTKMQNDISV